MDATRISDGTLVYIKRTPVSSEELQILSYLNSEEIRQDPRNHCIALLDMLRDAADPNITFMVMPFMKYIDSPPMERVKDVLDCFDQILEVSTIFAAPIKQFLTSSTQGLGFIHDHGITHR